MPTTANDTDARSILAFLNLKAKRNYREIPANLSVITARLHEPGVDVAGVMKMIERQVERWAGTDMEEYLRPETLFRKSKFDSYYANRDLPARPTASTVKATGSVELILRQKELDRVEEAIRIIRAGYSENLDMTSKDRAELLRLRTRKEELKKILGLFV